MATDTSTAMTSDDDLFDPLFLDRLRVLALQVRRRRRQRRQGPAQTPAAGHTREFKDHRHYARGDDYRSIDWRVFARLDRLFVRVFEEIQEYHVHVLLDRSTSMFEPCPRKRRDALRLTVAIGYLALSGGHRLSLHSISDTCRRELPPLKGQGHVHGLIDHCRQLTFAGTSDLATSLPRFSAGNERRGIAFVISDCLGNDPARTIPALKTMRSWPAESHLIQVIDPAERAPTLEGELRLEDVESGEQRRVWLTRDDLARYRTAFTGWCDDITRSCAGWQLDHIRWDTAQPFEDQFLAFLERGSALSGG
jgi:uncharacterized protein (DUF58 family)